MQNTDDHSWAYYQERLDAISEYKNIPYCRAYDLFDNEEKHAQKCLQYKGYLALSDAFKCLFLETVELLNTECRPKITTQLSESYALFVPRLVHSFKSLCGSERLALKGYPLPAYALLRNIFDNLVMVSAVLQRITDFYSMDGIELEGKIDLKELKKKKKKTECDVRSTMTGARSGLSQATIDELKIWDDMFDWETHGSRLSLAASISWMKSQEPLSVLPEFLEREFAMFMNRYCEIAWMVHRLLPMLQPLEAPLGNSWHEKWRIVDESFEAMVSSLTKQLGKPIGAAIVEFVSKKFPFNEKSVFPL
jgi:hypothetical protein